MNTQLQDSFKVPYCVQEADADGAVVAPETGDTCTVVSADTASLTVVPDASVDSAKIPTGSDPSTVLQTGFLVGGKKAQVGVAVTFTVVHADGSAAPPATVDLLDIVVGPASTLSVSLGTPVSQ